MTVEDSVSSIAPPALVVRTKGAVRTLWPGRSYQVGRNPAADIPIDDDRVSWQHGVLRTDEHGWAFEDVGSMNGTFVHARRIRRAGIDGEIEFRLGSAQDGAQLACSVPPAMVRRTGVYRQPITTAKGGTRRLRIGRSPDNDIVVPDLIVSRHHAELRETCDGQYEIVDLGGHNGTFVNGRRVTSAVLDVNDIVGIGHATFRVVGNDVQAFVDTGDISLIAQGLIVR